MERKKFFFEIEMIFDDPRKVDEAEDRQLMRSFNLGLEGAFKNYVDQILDFEPPSLGGSF